MAYDASGAWKPEQDSAAAKVAEITSQDSPLMQRAQGIGMAQAARRGLSNSTMAARAGATAAIDAATPLAQQDASQTFQKNLSLQNAGQAKDLSAQEAGQNLTLADKNAQIETALQTLRGNQAIDLQTLTGDQAKTLAAQNAEAERTLQVLRGDQSMDLQTLSGSQTSALADKNNAAEMALQGVRGDQALQLQDRETAGQIQVANVNNQNAGRNQATASSAQLINSYNDAVAAIMVNTSMTADARTAALAAVKASTDAGVALISQASGLQLGWGTRPAADAAVAPVQGIGAAQVQSPAATPTSTVSPAYRRAGDIV